MRRPTGYLASGIGSLVLLGCLSCAGVIEERVESPEVKGRSVMFRLKAPSARTVQIAGDWFGNNWGSGDAEAGEVLVGLMSVAGDEGVWEVTVDLEPGRYRYRFLVNESQWMLDPQNPRIVDDGRGGKANLLVMP